MKNSKGKMDYIIIFVCLSLVCIGLIFIYSASNYSAEKDFNNKYYFLIKQAIGVAIGIVCMLTLTAININTIYKLSIPLVVISIVLLSLVFVNGIGVENYGAKRWIGLFGVTIQPSEIAKFSLVLFAAAYLGKYKDRASKINGVLPVILVGGIFCALIILEPNMSITMCVGLTLLVMLFIGGLSGKVFAVIVAICLCAVPILIVIEPYRVLRLLAFLDPWASPKGEGYQLIQSFYALGGGGWFGVGLFNSRQKLEFLPFAESDFIFAIIGEEAGFVGCLVVILLFFVLIYRGSVIAIKANNLTDCLLAGGITCVIAIQSMLNIAVVSGTIPPTGLPLPFVSYGGSSVVVFMSAVGLLANISRQNNKMAVLQEDTYTINESLDRRKIWKNT